VRNGQTSGKITIIDKLCVPVCMSVRDERRRALNLAGAYFKCSVAERTLSKAQRQP